jgi:hypothetical protein
MQETIYLQNGVTGGYIDAALQKQDVTVPPIVPMPASWNEPKTRYRVRIIGSFGLPQPGDLFIRKFWIGKTAITRCNSHGIRPDDSRLFWDEHDIIWYGDNLHAIYSRHSTGEVSIGGFTPGDSNTGNTEKFTGAVPSTFEMSASDAPFFVDGNLNNVSISVFAQTQDPQAKIAYSIRDFTIEKISL